MLVLCLKVTRFKTMKSHLIALVLNFIFYIKRHLGKATAFYTSGHWGTYKDFQMHGFLRNSTKELYLGYV